MSLAAMGLHRESRSSFEGVRVPSTIGAARRELADRHEPGDLDHDLSRRNARRWRPVRPRRRTAPLLRLLGQQYRTVHPYTHAAPAAWAWTDLPGGVPDADDTPGALLAVMNLCIEKPLRRPMFMAAADGVRWLLGSPERRRRLAARFCRGWGLLPFDRSSRRPESRPVPTGPSCRWSEIPAVAEADPSSPSEIAQPVPEAAEAVRDGFRFLDRAATFDGELASALVRQPAFGDGATIRSTARPGC